MAYMMRNPLWLALSIAPLLAACTDDDVVTGYRSDGLQVTCEGQGDDLSKCTPDDGDAACETWEQGGSANVLWPPNHKMVRFTLDACVGIGAGTSGSSCTPPPVDQPPPPDTGGPIILLAGTAPAPAATPKSIIKITVDEEIEVGALGDGNTAVGDAAIIDATTFELRSERQGGSDGRVYRVHYRDSAGAEGSCEILVPHDRGPVSGATDSGTKVTLTP